MYNTVIAGQNAVIAGQMNYELKKYFENSRYKNSKKNSQKIVKRSNWRK